MLRDLPVPNAMSAPPPRNPSYDPLFLNEPLEHRVQFPVLGIPVRFATNDRAVMEQIEAVFGHWRDLDSAAVSRSAGLDIRIFVQEGDEGPDDEPPLTYRAPDPMRWIVHTPGSFGLADLERMSGVAYVTRTLVADTARFRVCIVQFLTLIILTIEDRTPVHAAMIGRGDSALLLAGNAGTGKSTLAYASSKAGWDVMSDDAAYIQLEPRRVWGSGTAVLLLEDVVSRFPELSSMPATMFPTGKRKMMVSANDRSPRRWVSRAGVCVLQRTGGPVRVTRISADEVQSILTFDPAGAGVRFGPRLAESAAWVSEGGGWRLSLSSDPSEAIPALEEILHEVSSRV